LNWRIATRQNAAVKTILALILLGVAGIYLIATAKPSDPDEVAGVELDSEQVGAASTPLLVAQKPEVDAAAERAREAAAEQRATDAAAAKAREAAARREAAAAKSAPILQPVQAVAAAGPALPARSQSGAIEVPLESVPLRPRARAAGEGRSADSDETASLRRIDRWLRAPTGDRPAVEAGMEPGPGGELKSFRRLFEGGGSGYVADLRLGLPESLGREFLGYARSFAEQGVDGLDRALASETTLSPAALAWTEALVVTAMERGNYAVAGAYAGRMLTVMLDSGYDRNRVLAHRETVASLARRAASFLPWQAFEVPPGASMDPICRRLRREGLPINIGWLADFNDKRTSSGRHYRLRAGETLRIPRTPLRSEIWRQQRIHVVYAGDIPVRLLSVSVGRAGFETPLGAFHLETLIAEPKWYQPNGAPLEYGDPKNPLGERWLGFSEKPNYGLHGTNSDPTVGGFESEGCVRHRNADIVDLFDLLAPGGEVVIRP